MNRDQQLYDQLSNLSDDFLKSLAKGFNHPTCYMCRINAHIKLLESPFGEMERNTYENTRNKIREIVDFCQKTFTDNDICNECKPDVDSYYLKPESEYCYLCKKWSDHSEPSCPANRCLESCQQ